MSAMGERIVLSPTFTRRGCKLPERGKIAGPEMVSEARTPKGALTAAVLGLICTEGALAPAEVAARLGADQHAVGRILRRAVEAGLLERVGPQGGRYRRAPLEGGT
jgi:hypothetical protein